MTYRWEPTTPLDRILEAGFKRIDEAVEGVIANYTWEIPEPAIYHASIKEWSRRKTYFAGEYAAANLGSDVLISITGFNKGNNPLTSPCHWSLLEFLK